MPRMGFSRISIVSLFISVLLDGNLSRVYCRYPLVLIAVNYGSYLRSAENKFFRCCFCHRKFAVHDLSNRMCHHFFFRFLNRLRLSLYQQRTHLWCTVLVEDLRCDEYTLNLSSVLPTFQPICCHCLLLKPNCVFVMWIF
jgi:hypothetical protein